MRGIAIVLFSDLVDSTAMLARLGDDRMDRVVRSHLAEIANAVEDAGGRVVKSLGDGAMATFGSALGALQAASAIQHSVERLDAAEGTIGLAARVGISAGEPIANDGDLSGMSVVVASRLCAAAQSGEVLVHEVVQSLVGSREGATFGDPAGYELKGIPGSVGAAPLHWRDVAIDLAPAPVVPEPPSLPRVLASFAGEPLVGRDDELAVLRGVTSFEQQRQAVVLLGEPGIGKTRLAAAAAEQAHEAGALVILARCPPEPTISFEPWVRAIGEIGLAGDTAARQALAAAAGAELASLVPELAEHAPPRVDGASTDTVAAEGARYRLLRGVGAALAYAAGERPVCIVLDDAHWCDLASAQVLVEILERAPFDRFALVVTARDRELGRGHPISRTLADVRRAGDLRELKLGGLDAGGLAALVSARVGRAITPRLAARLLTRTKGNPFFAGELARDLDDREALRDGALDSAPVPDAVAGLVDERLSRLDEATERFLVAAAAIGPSAPVALAATAADLDSATAESAVAQAVAERLVDEAAALQPAVTFPHALVREAFAAMLEPAAAARLHHAIAEALAVDPSAEPAELARHRTLAAPVTGPEPAIAAHRAAAETAAEGHDHEAAATHLDLALTLMPEHDPDRGRLFLALGDQRILAVDLRRARTAYLAAADMARASGDNELFAKTALGFAGGVVGFNWELPTDDPQVPALLREALTLPGYDTELELGLIFRLLYATPYEHGEGGRSALVARAEQIAEGHDDPSTQFLLNAARFGSSFSYSPDPLDAVEQLADWQALVDLAEQTGRDDWLQRALLWAANSAWFQGDAKGCDELIERAGVVAARLGTPRFTWEVDESRAERMFTRGDAAAAMELGNRASETIGRLRPDIQAGIGLASHWAYMSFYSADLGAATAGARSMVSAWEGWGAAHALLPWFQSMNGENEAAWAGIDRILDSDLERLRGLDGTFGFALAATAHAAAAIGHEAAGERIRPLLERLRSRILAVPPSLHFAMPAEFAIGLLEMLAGRHSSAAEELYTAVARADELEIDYVRSLARVELARALFRGGEPSDLGAAQDILAEAVALAEATGVQHALDQAAKLQAEMDGRPLATTLQSTARSRPLRALAARSGRRALATLVRGLDDRAVEERFIAPRRQRALLRAMARAFQPAEANGYEGVIAYEIEPFSVDAPPDAPWRWAIELGATSARLVEPAPLDATLTIYIGLADWVRVIAGEQDPLTSMAAGRCRVEGDVLLASLLEPMFGAA